jgi:hypothetical protein
MTLDEFRTEVIKRLQVKYLFSYCPICYCLPAIVNSHNCEEGWSIYFNSNLTDEDKITACVQYMKKNRCESIIVENK